MPSVSQVFWRAVTNSDYFNVERGPGTGPSSGGGQLYFSISFGDHLDHAALGTLLGVDPPESIATTRPSATIDVAVLDDPDVIAPLEFRARYRPPRLDDRYYIARQNRRRPTGERHPAWMPDRGFPAAPADITGPNDPAIPDLSLLKICVLRDNDGGYHAAFVNSALMPMELPASVDVLFTTNADCPPNGLLLLPGGTSDLEDWRTALHQIDGMSREGLPTAPELEDAVDGVARRAGARASGQGFRESYDERRAIELHAMGVAIAQLRADGWTVTDVSTTHSYDLHCRRGNEVLRTEVKGTTGDGSAVLLTPREVEVARESHPETALVVVSAITLEMDGDDFEATGGDITLISPWSPDESGELIPVGFRYVLRA
jgi:hypothetical protein